MNIKVKKTRADAVVPKYAKPGDAGLDLYATTCFPHKTHFGTVQIDYGTGISVEIPEGYVGLIFPRSSIRDKSLRLTNAVGVIDSGYRGEIRVTFDTVGNDHMRYKVRDRIAQLVIIPCPKFEIDEVETLSETERGSDGFGSTGDQ